MKKHKENLFSTKFRLLNSQELSEEIIWSSSDSSEFEDVGNKPNSINTTNKKPNRKRKRISKVPKNVSNLDITIIDVNKDSQGDISPVLTCKTKPKMVEKDHDRTYSVSHLPDYKSSNDYSRSCKKELTSPVLCTGTVRANLSIKSPIIPQKFASPVYSPKVRKKLFSENEKNSKVKIGQKCESPVLSNHFELDRRKPLEENDFKNAIEVSSDTPILEIQDSLEFQEHEKPCRASSKSKINVRLGGGTTVPPDIELIKKVKSFFDNHFNSESSSQVSIADTPTPKNTSSDDLEILSITQQTPNENSVKTTRHTNSTDNSTIEAEKSKKLRYKKDGLAYRLCSLLKKHSANISLWQHERFLAENSNFKIPKGEHLVFRIQKVNFKYGSYLLETVDANDELFLILISKGYMNNCIFNVDSVFKLYEPYQLFNFDDNKLIVNVCKFECISIDV